MSAPLHLVPVEALTRPSERFGCTPLAAIVTAQTCIARRAAAIRSPLARVEFASCVGCALGAQVAQRLGAPRAVVELGIGSAASTCTFPGCALPVHRLAGGFAGQPICVEHMRRATHIRTVRGVASHEAVRILLSGARDWRKDARTQIRGHFGRTE